MDLVIRGELMYIESHPDGTGKHKTLFGGNRCSIILHITLLTWYAA